MSVKKAGTVKPVKHWKNGSIPIDDTEMDYIVFGQGRKPFIMLPGLGDGLKSAKGMALPFSVLYRKLGAHYRVYAFSRRRRIPEGFTTRDIAEDVARAMDTLGIRRAYILGVSIHRLFWNSWMVCIQNFRKRNPQKSDEKDKSKFVEEKTDMNYRIIDGAEKMNLEDIVKLLKMTYWADKRSVEQIDRSLHNSSCYGVYIDAEQKLVGFARVISDYATTYYLCDVIIDKDYQHNGFGKALVSYIEQLPLYAGLRGILLTRDAHALYRKFGYEVLNDRVMVKSLNC